MAQMATNGDSGLSTLSKAPPGVVLPPKDIQTIIEKTAGYVARNPPAFEDRFRTKESKNPRFSFLLEHDAYYPFYSWRLSEVRSGRGTDISAGRTADAAQSQPAQPTGPPAPPDFQFSARMPNISAQDLDVLKLTALFVARNGRQFMTTLQQRAAGDYQWEFLRATHSLYPFFNKLVEQYTDLIRLHGVEGGGKLEQARADELRKIIANPATVLVKASQRAEFVKHQQKQKKEKEEADEKEKIEYAMVDWHDWELCDEILFTDADDHADLPPPTSLADLQSASLEQKGAMSLAPTNRRIEEAMPTGDDFMYDAYGQPIPGNQQIPPAQLPYIPQAPQAQPAQQGYAPPPVSQEDDEETARIQAREEERARAQQSQANARSNPTMNIRANYVPRAAAQAASRRGQQMAICPQCKQQIPVNELDEHMRIELLDPRWKEQKAKADARFSATTMVTPQAVSSGVKRFASQRSDDTNDYDRRKR